MFELLKKFNLKYEDLTADEIATLDKWSQSLASRSISLPDIKEYLDAMIASVERELAGYETPQTFVSWIFRKKRMGYLSARLYNYIMLRDFCSAPEKAKKFAEKQLERLSANKPK